MNYIHRLNGKSTVQGVCCGLLLVMSTIVACGAPGETAPTETRPGPTPTTAVATTPATATPTAVQPSPVPPTPTAVAQTEVPATAEPADTPTPTRAIEPPAGFKQYQDSETGVSVYIPESWFVTGIIPGEWAILQSYPENKYVGGEPRQPGDTKCDLVIRPPGFDIVSHLERRRSDPSITVLSESELVLASGRAATRAEIESMGRSISLYAEIGERVVVLTCWGELAPFDEIAVTLGVSE